MLWGAHDAAELEVRKRASGAVNLAGRFPYGRNAVLSDGGRTGRPRKERIASRAFAYRVERADEDIHLLVGHDYGKPLASKRAGTLALEDGDDALEFRATITPQVADTSHGRDALALLEAGLAIGISPGFRIPPKRAVPNAETMEDEPNRPGEGMHRAMIRTVLAALLYELSLVTRPAYDEAQVEARSWSTMAGGVTMPAVPPSMRWRA